MTMNYKFYQESLMLFNQALRSWINPLLTWFLLVK